MARGPGVFGPYRHGNRWRVVCRGSDGRASYRAFDSERKARRWVEAAKAAERGALTVGEALRQYEGWMLDVGHRGEGNKPRSVATTMDRLGRWHDEQAALAAVTPADVVDAYESRRESVSVDTARNELAEVKSFWRWVVKQGHVEASPADAVQAKGKRRHGKAQLRLGEAQRLSHAALAAAREGDEGAEAVLVALWLGLRSQEICQLEARDVDVGIVGGRRAVWLWVTDSKTTAGRRTVEVPPELGELLEARARRGGLLYHQDGAADKPRTRTWMRRTTVRLCDSAGVPKVCPHGLRGTNATLADLAAVAPLEVARSLGHSDVRVAEQSYSQARQGARARRGFEAIVGGRLETWD